MESTCIEETDQGLECSSNGLIAALYYLNYRTVGMLSKRLSRDYVPKIDKDTLADSDFVRLMRILCNVHEYDELPVRHNEDLLNKDWENSLPVPANEPYKPGQIPFGGFPSFYAYDNSHLKAFLLLQAHFSGIRTFPISDYAMDMISVLDQSVRVLQAMADLAADQGFLATTRGIVTLMQSVKQGLWPVRNLDMLPGCKDIELSIRGRKMKRVQELFGYSNADVRNAMKEAGVSEVEAAMKVLSRLPDVKLRHRIEGVKFEDGKYLLEKDAEYDIKVDIQRSNGAEKRAYCPRFPKPQSEGWWMLIAEEKDDEIHLMKRVNGGMEGNEASSRNLVTSLPFSTPEEPGEYEYKILCLSDCYIGFDFEKTFKFVVS